MSDYEVRLKLNGRHAFFTEFLRFVAVESDAFNANLVLAIADQIEAQTPKPKPAEPSGWGAVIEDDKGLYWTLVAPDSGAWANYGHRGYKRYDDLNAVRVLSVGVSA